MSNQADENAVRNQRERYLELAAMYKEKFKGTKQSLDKILAKFAVQEGLGRYKARAALKLLIECGLIKVSKGNKSWKYDAKEEWELFYVEI